MPNTCCEKTFFQRVEFPVQMQKVKDIPKLWDNFTEIRNISWFHGGVLCSVGKGIF